MVWCGFQASPGYGMDSSDVQLHAILLVEINLGIHYDEGSKLLTENSSINSDEIHFSITETIKNDTFHRNYRICECPVNYNLYYRLFIDTSKAVMA